MTHESSETDSLLDLVEARFSASSDIASTDDPFLDPLNFSSRRKILAVLAVCYCEKPSHGPLTSSLYMLT